MTTTKMPLLNTTPILSNTTSPNAKDFDILIRHYNNNGDPQETHTSLTNRVLPKPPKKNKNNYFNSDKNFQNNSPIYFSATGYVSAQSVIGFLTREKISFLDKWHRKIWSSTQTTNLIINCGLNPGLWKNFNIFGSNYYSKVQLFNKNKNSSSNCNSNSNSNSSKNSRKTIKNRNKKLSQRINPKFLPAKLQIDETSNSSDDQIVKSAYEKAPGGKVKGISPFEIKTGNDENKTAKNETQNTNFTFPDYDPQVKDISNKFSDLFKNSFHQKDKPSHKEGLRRIFCPNCHLRMAGDYSKITSIKNNTTFKRHYFIKLDDFKKFKTVNEPKRKWGSFMGFTVMPLVIVCVRCEQKIGRMVTDNPPSLNIKTEKYCMFF